MRMMYPMYPAWILNAPQSSPLSAMENQVKKSERRERKIPIPMTRELPERWRKLKLSRAKIACILFFSFRFFEFVI